MWKMGNVTSCENLTTKQDWWQEYALKMTMIQWQNISYLTFLLDVLLTSNFLRWMWVWQRMDHGIWSQFSTQNGIWMTDRQEEWQKNKSKFLIWCEHGTHDAKSKQIPHVGNSAAICHLQKQQHVIQSQFNTCRSFARMHAKEQRCVASSTIFGSQMFDHITTTVLKIKKHHDHWLNTQLETVSTQHANKT